MATNGQKWLQYLGIGEVIFGATIFIFLGGCASAPPDGVRRYTSVLAASIEPADRGDQWKVGYQTLPFVKLKSGEVVTAILNIEQPRFTGPGGAVRNERVWEYGITVIGDGHASLNIPIDDDIAEYLILVRPLEKKGKESLGPWSYWVFAADKVNGQKAPILAFPHFQKLPLLSEREDAAEFTAKERAARQYNNK